MRQQPTRDLGASLHDHVGAEPGQVLGFGE
jgi:hypothetical protein